MNNKVTMFLALALVLLVSCRTTSIMNPGRLTVHCPSREHMRDAIADALKGRRWVVTNEQPDSIEASLILRKHSAKISIDFDADSFDISFVDSSGLKYQKKSNGAETIHKNYNGWIQNLVQDIRANAQR